MNIISIPLNIDLAFVLCHCFLNLGGIANLRERYFAPEKEAEIIRKFS
jgi:hypothetical protein